MYLFYCDICQVPIKEDEDRYILAINKTKGRDLENDKEFVTIDDFIRRLQENKKYIKTYEICKKCKKVLEHFLNLRIKEIRKIQRELEQLEEKENDKR